MIYFLCFISTYINFLLLTSEATAQMEHCSGKLLLMLKDRYLFLECFNLFGRIFRLKFFLDVSDQ